MKGNIKRWDIVYLLGLLVDDKDRYRGMDEAIQEYRQKNNLLTYGELFLQKYYDKLRYNESDKNKYYNEIINTVKIEWMAALKNNCFRLYDIGELVWKL